MGMTASQARLLSITARLSDNEHAGQSVSFAKQRLADQTEYIQADYNAALAATKLTVLTGFVGADPQYTDISYSLMTGPQMAENTKQYVVTDTKGRVLVTKDIAQAFVDSKGDYNRFLAKLGYSQSDMLYTKLTGSAEQQEESEQKIHEAWDKYFKSVGGGYGDHNEHDFFIGWKDCDTNLTNNTPTPTTDAVPMLGYAYQQPKRLYNFMQLYQTEDGAYTTEPLELDPDDPTDTTKAKHNRPVILNSSGNAVTAAHASTDHSSPAIVSSSLPSGYEVAFVAVPVENPESAPLLITSDYKFEYNEATGLYTVISSSATGTATTVNTTTGAVTYNPTNATKYSATDLQPIPINYSGTSQAQQELFDYAVAITADYYSTADMSSLKKTTQPENVSMLTYYKNIFNEMSLSGYYTYGQKRDEQGNIVTVNGGYDENFLPVSQAISTQSRVKIGGEISPLEDNNTFEQMLRKGQLQIKYFSAVGRQFVPTTINEDQGIQEVPDDKKRAIAEAQYEQSMTDLEKKDKMFDMDLKKLDTEHNTLQTEYDSLKSVIDKNIEKTFNMFS